MDLPGTRSLMLMGAAGWGAPVWEASRPPSLLAHIILPLGGSHPPLPSRPRPHLRTRGLCHPRGRGLGLQQGHGQVTNILVSGCKTPSSAQPEATGHRGLHRHLSPSPSCPPQHRARPSFRQARPPGPLAFPGTRKPSPWHSCPHPGCRVAHRPGCPGTHSWDVGTHLCDTGRERWGALSACGLWALLLAGGRPISRLWRCPHPSAAFGAAGSHPWHEVGWAGPRDTEPPPVGTLGTQPQAPVCPCSWPRRQLLPLPGSSGSHVIAPPGCSEAAAAGATAVRVRGSGREDAPRASGS